MKHCNNCGEKIYVKDRFCGNCGAKVEEVSSLCPNCGNTIQPDEKFCSECGEPTQLKKDKRHTQKTVVSNHGKASRKPTRPQKRKTSSFIKLIKSLFVVAALGAGIFIVLPIVSDKLEDPIAKEGSRYEKSLETSQRIKANETKSKIIPKAKSNGNLFSEIVKTDSLNAVVNASPDLTVIFPAGMFDEEQKVEIADLKPMVLPNGKESFYAVDLSLENAFEFDNYVEIQVETPVDFNPQQHFAQCFTQHQGTWESVLSFYDPQIGKIRAFTNHFTSFAYTYQTFELIHDPMMKVAAGAANIWGRLTSTAEADLLEGYDPNKIMQQQDDDYLAACWNSGLELYGLTAAGLSFSENVLAFSELGDINSVVGDLGYGLALINAAMDAQRGNKKKAVLETLKNTYNWGSGKLMNSRALNIAFIGVFAIDYSLTSFANEAWAGRKQLYRTVFDNFQYQQRVKEGKKLRWWKKQIKWRMQDAKDASKFEEVVEKLIQEYIQNFWEESFDRAIIQAELQNHGWTFDAGINRESKAELDAEFRHYILQYIQPLIERLQLDYLLKAKDLQRKKIEEFGNMLNQEHQIRSMVELEGDEDDAAEKYEGARVIFNVRKEILKMWQGYLNKEAMIDLYCTKAGYIHAGLPQKATLIIDPENEKKSDKYEAAFELKSSRDETRVIFSLEKKFTEYLWTIYQLDPPVEFTGKSLEACEQFVQNDLKKLKDIISTSNGWDKIADSASFDQMENIEKHSKYMYVTRLPSSIFKEYNSFADFNDKEGNRSTRMLKNDIYIEILDKDHLAKVSYEYFLMKDPKKSIKEYGIVAYYSKGEKVKN